MDSCDVGKFLKKDCHLTTLTHSYDTPSFLNVLDFSKEDQHLLQLRIRYTPDEHEPLLYICPHHYAEFLTECYEERCCDPFNCHKQPVKTNLIVASQTVSMNLKTLGYELISGQKICRTCYSKLKVVAGLIETPKSPVEDTRVSDLATSSRSKKTKEKAGTGGTSSKRLTRSSGPVVVEDPTESESSSSSSCISDSNDSIYSLDSEYMYSEIPGRATHKQKIEYARKKRLLATAEFSDKIAKKLCIEPTELIEENTSSKFQESVINAIKAKMLTCSKSETMALLTIIPEFWTVKRLSATFQISMRQAKRAKKFKKVQGIMPTLTLPPKRRPVFSEETTRKVSELYESDDISRLCPDPTEKMSVEINGEKVDKQKRVMLMKLKDAFLKLKEKHPGIKICLSKFCTLKPKWFLCYENKKRQLAAKNHSKASQDSSTDSSADSSEDS